MTSHPPPTLTEPTSRLHHARPRIMLVEPTWAERSQEGRVHPWGKPLQQAGSQQVAWPCTIVPSDSPPSACISPWHRASRPQMFKLPPSLILLLGISSQQT